MNKKIVVGINTLTSVDQPVYSNHCQLWFRLGRNMQDYDFILNNPRRMSIDRMRNMTAEAALANDCDYICFIDDDVMVPFDGLQRLINHDVDIVAGWTIIRGYPFDNMIFKWVDDGLVRWNDLPQKEGLLECGAIGFSFALIKVSVLRQMPAPFFVTGPRNTEDIYFCVKAKKYIPDIKIYVDLDVKTSHCLGTEYIDPLNKGAFRELYEKVYPELYSEEKPPLHARGDSYLEMIKDPSPETAQAHVNAGN